MRAPVRSAVCAAAVVAVAFAPIAAAVPSVAAPTSDGASSRTDFTAGVQSIQHGLSTVTVTGTAPVGTSIEVAGDVVAPVWTEADAGGSWTAAVRVHVGQHTIRVTSAVSGRVIDLPVDLLVLNPPEMSAVVDGIARTITLEGSGRPGAHLVLRDGGASPDPTDEDDVVGETDVDEHGNWDATLRDLAWGEHHIEVWQYFDGAHNGGVDQVYRISGAPTVTTSTASRETERITLAGRAPIGSTLTFADADGPVLGADGEPIRVATDSDTSWRAELPIPDDARFHRVVVTAYEDDVELGATEATVTIPIALTGTVEELADGSVRLSGTGEPGARVDLETERGEPITDDAGAPIGTEVGRSWELTLDRDTLSADVVVARQRIGGVEQGGIRLVLPKLPVRPGPGGQGGGHGGSGGSSSPDISSGTFSKTHGPASAGLVSGPGRLAYTGSEAPRMLGAAAAAVSAGAGILLATGRRRHRRTPNA